MPTFDSNPLIKRTNSPVAVRFDHSVARRLKECDDVRTFTEGGQFYILGFKGRERHVYAHASKEEWQRYIDPSAADIEQYPGPFSRR